MNIETMITLIATVGGLSGLISAISTTIFKAIEYKKVKKGETLEAKLDSKLQPLLDQQKEAAEERAHLANELHEIRLDTTRTQLIMLMEHQPHNHDTIIKVGERYFCQLHGDWYCTSLFKDWAKKEGVELPDRIYQATKHHEGEK